MKIRLRVLTFIVIVFQFTMTIAQDPNPMDWPNFKQFEEPNAKLAKIKKNKNRVVFMGNSITIGWLQTNPNFFKDKDYVNRGISGQTTSQMLVRFRADVVDINADVVVILAGTNDIAGNTGPVTLKMIANNLKSMTEIAQANGIKVILCSVLPAYDYPWSPGKKPNIKIPKLNSMIEDFAKESGAFYLDYFKALNDGNNGIIKEYSYDGVHLTAKGYHLLEPMLEKALNKVLNLE